MEMDIRSNLKAFEDGLNDAARREVPFAVSEAINSVALKIQRNETKRLSKVLDRPTPFTLKAYAVRRSSKRNLQAVVFAKDRQADYLKWHEEGGTRHPEGRAIPVPGAAVRLNKYGNMPKGRIKKALAGPAHFSGKPRGSGRPAGVWQRMGTKKSPKLRLVAHWADRADYRSKLRFVPSARKTAEAVLARQVLDEVLAALRPRQGK